MTKNTKEIWKGVIYQGEDYSNRLEVSNMGRLRNVNTKHIYKTSINKQTGYEQVNISLGSKNSKKVFKIHKCVAESFIANPCNLLVINHKDGNKLNNHIGNLEWSTYSDNTKHAINNGLFDINVLTDTCVNRRKLNNEDIEYIKNSYIPKDRNFGSRALSKKYNVAHTTILEIIKNKTYKNIA